MVRVEVRAVRSVLLLGEKRVKLTAASTGAHRDCRSAAALPLFAYLSAVSRPASTGHLLPAGSGEQRYSACAVRRVRRFLGTTQAGESNGGHCALAWRRLGAVAILLKAEFGLLSWRCVRAAETMSSPATLVFKYGAALWVEYARSNRVSCRTPHHHFEMLGWRDQVVVRFGFSASSARHRPQHVSCDDQLTAKWGTVR